MKKNSIYTWITMLFILPLWIGCSNEMEDSDSNSVTPEYNGEAIPVFISVKETSTPTTTRAEQTQPKIMFSQPLDKSHDTGYDIVTTITEIETMPQTRANSPLANARYRLLAYRGAISSANYAGQGDFTTDDSGKATVTGDQLFLAAGEYTFVCYSLGKDEVLPTFDSTTTLISVSQGDDFMSCIQSNVAVEANADGKFVLNNTFTRQCAQVILEVSVAGFPDNTINACAATMNNMNDNSITWDFKLSPVLTTSGTSGSVDFAWTTLGTNLVASDGQIVLPISQRNLSITLTTLTVGTETLNNTIVEIPDVQLNPTKNYRVTVELDRNYIPIGNYKWAKGNIYKEGNNFYFEATQEAFHDGLTGGTYFDWNTTDVGVGTNNPGNYSMAQDPCASILPEGTWLTPSKEEFNALIDNATPEWDEAAHGMWFGTAPNRLFLPAIGIRSPDAPPSIFNDGTFAFYSSRDGQQSPFFYNIALSIDAFSGAVVVDEMSRTVGMPIRCIKK